MEDLELETEEIIEKKIRPNAVRIRNILIVVLILVLIVVGGYFIWHHFRYKDAKTTNDASIFTWEGSYVDTTNYQTTMTIEKGFGKKEYNVSISMGEDNSADLIFWQFTAFYDDQSETLTYAGGKRSDWIVADDTQDDDVAEGDNAEAEAANKAAAEAQSDLGDDAVTVSGDQTNGALVTEVVYEDGTGHLEVKNGKITWVDNKENFGNGLVFERVE